MSIRANLSYPGLQKRFFSETSTTYNAIAPANPRVSVRPRHFPYSQRQCRNCTRCRYAQVISLAIVISGNEGQQRRQHGTSHELPSGKPVSVGSVGRPQRYRAAPAVALQIVMHAIGPGRLLAEVGCVGGCSEQLSLSMVLAVPSDMQGSSVNWFKQ